MNDTHSQRDTPHLDPTLEQVLADRATGRPAITVKKWWAEQTKDAQEQALHSVVFRGPSALAQTLIDLASEEMIANWRDRHGASLLHIAVWAQAENQEHGEKNTSVLLKHILEAGGGLALNAVDELGRTPLICAAACGDAYLVQFLIRVGADPDTAVPRTTTKMVNGEKHLSYDRLRGSALEASARGGHENLIEILLNAGADATLLDFNSLTKPGIGVDGTNVSRDILDTLRDARDLRRLGTSQRLRGLDFNQDTGDTLLTVPAGIRKLNKRTQAMALESLREGLVQEIHSLGQITALELDDSDMDTQPVQPGRTRPR
jgi:hypothetical protein